jgi:hypothetical protein
MWSALIALLGPVFSSIFKFLGVIQDVKKTQILEEGAVATTAIVEQGQVQTKWWFAAAIPPLFALPFIAYTWKVVVYDIMLGLGSTAPIGGTVGWVYTMVVGFYFLHVLGNQR